MNVDSPRVAHIVPSLAIGGMEKLVAHLVQHRSQSRTAVICLFELGDLGRALLAQGHRVVSLSAPRGKLSVVRHLNHHLRQLQTDVVHCHNLQAFTFGALAAQACRSMRIVLTKHGTRMPSEKTLGERMRVWLARRSMVVGVSPEICRLMANWSGQRQERISLIRNGLEVSASLPPRQQARQELGLPMTGRLVSCVARLSEEKDHETLLHAFRIVAAQQPETQLLLIGDGPRQSALTRLTSELGLASHVQFLGERDDVPQLLAASDLAVLSSRTEGMPLAILEAMAAQLPVVCTSVGGIPDMLTHHRQGLLVPAGDPALFAQAILQLSQDDQARQTMGQAGRQHVQDHFSLRSTLMQYETLYQEGSP